MGVGERMERRWERSLTLIPFSMMQNFGFGIAVKYVLTLSVYESYNWLNLQCSIKLGNSSVPSFLGLNISLHLYSLWQGHQKMEKHGIRTSRNWKLGLWSTFAYQFQLNMELICNPRNLDMIKFPRFRLHYNSAYCNFHKPKKMEYTSHRTW